MREKSVALTPYAEDLSRNDAANVEETHMTG